MAQPHNYNSHLSSTNLSIVQKRSLFSRSKIYHRLPTNTKLSADVNHFKSLLSDGIDEFYKTTSQ
jgi:hypothetical protein